MYEVLEKNVHLLDLLGAKDTRVFEIGTVFDLKEGGGIEEHVSLCLGLRTKQQGYVPKDDVHLEEICTALEEVLGTSVSWNREKGVAECNLSQILTLLPVPSAYEKSEPAVEISYVPFSLYPAISRDIALWVKEGTQPEEVRTVLDAHAGELRVRTTLFDTFTKDGKTSYAFRLVFQAQDRTLTDAEVQPIMDALYTAASKMQWEVR